MVIGKLVNGQQSLRGKKSVEISIAKAITKFCNCRTDILKWKNYTHKIRTLKQNPDLIIHKNITSILFINVNLQMFANTCGNN